MRECACVSESQRVHWNYVFLLACFDTVSLWKSQNVLNTDPQGQHTHEEALTHTPRRWNQSLTIARLPDASTAAVTQRPLSGEKQDKAWLTDECRDRSGIRQSCVTASCRPVIAKHITQRCRIEMEMAWLMTSKWTRRLCTSLLPNGAPSDEWERGGREGSWK